MKKLISWTLVAGALGAGLMAFSAGQLSPYIVNETGLAYNNTYEADLQARTINSASAQATYSSATFFTATFGDGTTSSGTFTISNNAALSSATASNKITVLSTAGLTGATLITQGYVLRNGFDWRTLDTASGTAANLAAAMNSLIPWLDASAAGNVVFATATAYGSYPNQFLLRSSTPTALLVSSRTFTGGLDNARIAVAGTSLLQGRDWFVGAASSATAQNISAAIMANATLNKIVVSTWAGSVVYATSTLSGTYRNFAMFSSTPAIVAANMAQGTNSAYALNGTTLTVSSHGFTTGLQVVFSTGAAASGTLGGNLKNGTTYFAILVDANHIGLAVTSTGAVAGQYITLTSSSTQSVANTFSLTPVAISGVATFKWQASNDLTCAKTGSWFDLSVSSVSVISYSNPPATTGWDFGVVSYRCLRVNVVAPTSGGLFLKVLLNRNF